MQIEFSRSEEDRIRHSVEKPTPSVFSVSLCGKECAAKAACKGITFDGIKNKCYLKKSWPGGGQVEWPGGQFSSQEMTEAVRACYNAQSQSSDHSFLSTIWVGKVLANIHIEPVSDAGFRRRFQTGFRPVSYRMQHSPCHSVFREKNSGQQRSESDPHYP